MAGQQHRDRADMGDVRAAAVLRAASIGGCRAAPWGRPDLAPSTALQRHRVRRVARWRAGLLRRQPLVSAWRRNPGAAFYPGLRRRRGAHGDRLAGYQYLVVSISYLLTRL